MFWREHYTFEATIDARAIARQSKSHLWPAAASEKPQIMPRTLALSSNHRKPSSGHYRTSTKLSLAFIANSRLSAVTWFYRKFLRRKIIKRYHSTYDRNDKNQISLPGGYTNSFGRKIPNRPTGNKLTRRIVEFSMPQLCLELTQHRVHMARRSKKSIVIEGRFVQNGAGCLCANRDK